MAHYSFEILFKKLLRRLSSECDYSAVQDERSLGLLVGVAADWPFSEVMLSLAQQHGQRAWLRCHAGQLPALWCGVVSHTTLLLPSICDQTC